MPNRGKGITRSRSEQAPFTVILPATSANLGPAFDAAALALRLFLKVGARVATEFSIRASGRDSAICSQLESHLILDTYREVLRSEGKAITPLALTLDNQIPIGKGCGSSASARLAGIALAVRYGRLGWNASQIISEASRLEQHPDNAAACWMGGLAVARMSAGASVQFATIEPKGKWPLLLAVPDDPLATEAARKILPAYYSRADAVANIQNSMLLLSAFVQGRPDQLAGALEDRMHQPYRAALCPLLPALQSLTNEPGILGIALSGAGPSALIFLRPQASISQTKSRVAGHLRSRHLIAELIPTAIFNRRLPLSK